MGLADGDSLELGDEVLDCAAADLDRDGVDDIILATSRGARVWRGGTTAGWQTTDWLPPMARHLPVGALAVVDVDRDGWSDLYLARHTIRRDRCAMFDCQGTACKPSWPLALVDPAQRAEGSTGLPGAAGALGVSGSVSVEDINHDGRPDLWLASTEDQLRGHQPGGGAGGRLGSGQRPRAASLWLDLNLDGVVDSVSGGMQASQWHGVGPSRSPTGPMGRLAADFNETVGLTSCACRCGRRRAAPRRVAGPGVSRRRRR